VPIYTAKYDGAESRIKPCDVAHGWL